MRGKVTGYHATDSRLRITPAYAGKSPRCPSAVTAAEDHPRLCGEKFRLALGDNDFTGSPPPMRGKAQVYVGAGVTERITPAYAGKSMS